MMRRRRKAAALIGGLFLLTLGVTGWFAARWSLGRAGRRFAEAIEGKENNTDEALNTVLRAERDVLFQRYHQGCAWISARDCVVVQRALSKALWQEAKHAEHYDEARGLAEMACAAGTGAGHDPALRCDALDACHWRGTIVVQAVGSGIEERLAVIQAAADALDQLGVGAAKDECPGALEGALKTVLLTDAALLAELSAQPQFGTGGDAPPPSLSRAFALLRQAVALAKEQRKLPNTLEIAAVDLDRLAMLRRIRTENNDTRASDADDYCADTAPEAELAWACRRRELERFWWRLEGELKTYCETRDKHYAECTRGLADLQVNLSARSTEPHAATLAVYQNLCEIFQRKPSDDIAEVLRSVVTVHNENSSLTNRNQFDLQELTQRLNSWLPQAHRRCGADQH
jgi:hypothetical protein